MPTSYGALRGRGFELHADTPQGVQVAGPGGRLAQFAAQPGQVDVDRLVVAVGLLPDLGEQFLAGYDDTGAPGEEGQQVELAPGEVEPGAVQLGLAAQRVDGEAADPDDAGDAASPEVARERRRTAAMRADRCSTEKGLVR